MTEGVESLIRHYGIVIAALLIFVTELGIPTGVPNEVVLVLAGSYAVHSNLEFAISFLIVTAADVLGTTSLYLLTRSGGHRLLRRWQRGDRPPGHSRLRHFIHRHDIAVIIVARSLPLVRMSVAISAGLLRIKRKHYVLGVIPGAIVWAGIPFSLGYLFRDDVRGLIDQDERLSQLALLALPLVIVAAVSIWLLHRRKAARGAVAAVPEESLATLPWETATDEQALTLKHEAGGSSSTRDG
ncbi:MAG TPA: DedA family protein [Thermomicrobiaceae bacterium]|nr:DedA family protein [Thermomicrobiaceae bacterium]